MIKHFVLEKLCAINVEYLTGSVSEICDYLKGLERSYESSGYHSFSIEKIGSTFWFYGSKEKVCRDNET